MKAWLKGGLTIWLILVAIRLIYSFLKPSECFNMPLQVLIVFALIIPLVVSYLLILFFKKTADEIKIPLWLKFGIFGAIILPIAYFIFVTFTSLLFSRGHDISFGFGLSGCLCESFSDCFGAGLANSIFMMMAFSFALVYYLTKGIFIVTFIICAVVGLMISKLKPRRRK